MGGGDACPPIITNVYVEDRINSLSQAIFVGVFVIEIILRKTLIMGKKNYTFV